MDPDERVVRRLFELSGEGRQAEISDFLHPEAIVVPSNMDPGREVTATEFRHYARDFLHGVSIHESIATDVVKVDQGRFVVSGRIVWSMPNGGFADRGAAWAVVVKDGLVFRIKGVSAVQDAYRVLERDDWSASHASAAS